MIEKQEDDKWVVFKENEMSMENENDSDQVNAGEDA